MDGDSARQQQTSAAGRGPVLSRRAALELGGSALALVGLGGIVRLLPSKGGFLRPPGALPEEQFLAQCIKCARCIDVCPLQALSPVLITDSILAAGTPRLTFRQGWCDLCMKCADICPTPALDPADKETIKLGLAEINHDECIAWNWEGCSRCYELCPLQAITMDDNKRPAVDAALCNGCGLCENICPSTTFRRYTGAKHKAIVIVPISPSGG